MIEAGLAWLAVLIFEGVQTLRKRPTMSQGAWALLRGKVLKVLMVLAVATLAIHLLWPVLHPAPPDPPIVDPPCVDDCADVPR